MSDAVDVPTGKVTPLEPGDPVEHPALSQMGGTFAERAAARQAAEGKAIQPEQTENKAVGRKRATKK